MPETEDGRVLFMIPWQGKVLLGTTDTPPQMSRSSRGPARGVDFILRTAASCLSQGPGRRDVERLRRPRPLISAAPGEPTGRLSREHVIRTSPSGLVTIGGRVDHPQANGRRGD